MAKQTITVDVECPDGWELVDYREAIVASREWVLSANCEPCRISTGVFKHWIVRRKRWRADKGGTYFALGHDFKPCEQTDHRGSISGAHYEANNYHRTPEACSVASIAHLKLAASMRDERETDHDPIV